eukprot:290016-Pleurochrysis_carterae.AAC.9
MGQAGYPYHEPVDRFGQARRRQGCQRVGAEEPGAQRAGCRRNQVEALDSARALSLRDAFTALRSIPKVLSVNIKPASR